MTTTLLRGSILDFPDAAPNAAEIASTRVTWKMAC